MASFGFKVDSQPLCDDFKFLVGILKGGLNNLSSAVPMHIRVLLNHIDLFLVEVINLRELGRLILHLIREIFLREYGLKVYPCLLSLDPLLQDVDNHLEFLLNLDYALAEHPSKLILLQTDSLDHKVIEHPH